jgi:hypothetical protein
MPIEQGLDRTRNETPSRHFHARRLTQTDCDDGSTNDDASWPL